MATALITALYGKFEPLRPLPENHGFDQAICVTDDPDLVASGWEMIYLPSDSHPRLAAKIPKMRPFDFVDTEIAVWIDAAFEVKGNEFKPFCESALDGKDFVVWEHPDLWHRSCLFEEAEFCQDWPKYSSWNIKGQTAHYRTEGMPEKFGLWACGTIAWKNNSAAKEFGAAWLEENLRWSIQDQVSFPYLVWKHKPNFGVFPAHEFHNPYLFWWRHPSDD